MKTQIPASVKIVAVSKTKPAADILEAYNTGHRIFGENRVSELVSKKSELPGDIEWHFIGHLQSNKVKQVVSCADMIQSVDSLKLLETIEKESGKNSRITNCLLQFHIAREETKYGFSPEEAHDLFSVRKAESFKNVSIRGVMGMATFTDDMSLIREEFRFLKKCFDQLKDEYFSNDDSFREISMGMSGDYMVAIEEGATIVRIGSLIFGERIKN